MLATRANSHLKVNLIFYFTTKMYSLVSSKCAKKKGAYENILQVNLRIA